MLELNWNIRRIGYTCSQFLMPKLRLSTSTNNINENLKNTKKRKFFQNDDEGLKVLIIGAGIAGLSAGEYLIQNGIRNIKIIEASKRVGGRIHSVHFGDAVCELGAKWINENDHLESVNKFACANNLSKSYFTKTKKFYMTNDGRFLDDDTVNLATLIFSNLLGGNSQSFNGKLEKNCGKYLENKIQEIMGKFSKNTGEKILKVFSVFENDISTFFGASPSMIHRKHLKNMLNTFTKPIFICDGLGKVVEETAKKLDNEHILLEKPIGTIQWDNLQSFEKPILNCLDKSKYVADHIIFTLPLGTLKIFHHLFFHPILPKEKLEAIFLLGYGSPTKIYLHYKENVSNWLPYTIKPIWNIRSSSNQSDWSNGITEICAVPNSKKVIEIKINGKFCEMIERLNDKIICDEITKVLRKFFNRYIPSPIEVLHSNWSTDVKFLGGLPYLSTINGKNHANQLGSPLFMKRNSKIPVVLFAGDATICEGFGTVDGARKSGIREAMRIVNLYKKQNELVIV